MAVFILAGSPLFFSSETSLFYRTLAPLFVLVCAVVVVGFRRALVRYQIPSVFTTATCSAAIIALMAMTYHRVEEGLVKMNTLEVASFREWMELHLDEFASGVIYVPPERDSVYAEGAPIGEYGNFWSERPRHAWGPIPVVMNELLNERAGETFKPVAVYAIPGLSAFPEGIRPYPTAAAADIFPVDEPPSNRDDLELYRLGALGAPHPHELLLFSPLRHHLVQQFDVARRYYCDQAGCVHALARVAYPLRKRRPLSNRQWHVLGALAAPRRNLASRCHARRLADLEG